MSALPNPVLQRVGGLLTPVTAAAFLSFLLGAALAAFANLFGDAAPGVLLAVALLPLLVLAVLSYPLVGAIAVLASFPVGSVGASVGPLSVQAAEAAVLLIGMLVILRRLGQGEVPLPWSPPLTWALALLGWCVVSLHSAVDTALAVKQMVALAGGLVFACVVLAACVDILDVRRFAGAFTAVATVISVTAISAGGAYESRFGGQAVVSGRLEGAFDHPNQLGSLCAMAAPIAAALVVGSRTRRARVLAGVGLVTILAALTLSLSRGAWVGAGLAFLLMLVTLREARRLVLVLSVPVVLLGLFVSSIGDSPSQLQVVEQRARALTELSPYDHRDRIYAEARREIRSDPVTGVGPGGFPVASARAGSESSTVSAQHAHNLGLTWAAETGLPGLLLIIAFAVSLGLATRTASQAFRARGDPHSRAITIGFGAALLSVAGQGFFDYTLRNAVVHIALWAVVGGLLVCRREALRYP